MTTIMTLGGQGTTIIHWNDQCLFYGVLGQSQLEFHVIVSKIVVTTFHMNETISLNASLFHRFRGKL